MAAALEVVVGNTSARRHGHDEASLLSRSHLCWVTHVIARGSKRALQAEDIPPVPKTLKAQPKLFAGAASTWAEARRRCPESPKLVQDVWWPLIRPEAPFIILGSFCSGLASTVGRTLFLRYVILSLDAANGYSTAASFGFGAGLVFMIWLENYSRSITMFWGGALTPVRVAAASKYLIARKALTAAVGSGSDGDATTLVGRDLSIFLQYSTMLPLLIGALVQLIGGVVMLIVLVGPAALGGLGAMIVLMGISLKVGGRVKGYTRDMLAAAAQTANGIQEMVDGAKVCTCAKCMRSPDRPPHPPPGPWPLAPGP